MNSEFNNMYIDKEFMITQEEINRFAEVSGGTGQIHVDPEYAKDTVFGGTLVHGLFILGLIEAELSKMESWSETGTLEVVFKKPVLVDSKINITLKQMTANEWDVVVFSETETVVVGKGVS